MKITGLNALQNLQRTVEMRPKPNRAEAASRADSYQPSSEVKEFSVALRAVTDAAEVRMDRVSALAAQVQAGEYAVNAYAIAAKMVDARA